MSNFPIWGDLGHCEGLEWMKVGDENNLRKECEQR